MWPPPVGEEGLRYGSLHRWGPVLCLLHLHVKNENRSDITPDPGGHRPQTVASVGVPRTMSSFLGDE